MPSAFYLDEDGELSVFQAFSCMRQGPGAELSSGERESGGTADTNLPSRRTLETYSHGTCSWRVKDMTAHFKLSGKLLRKLQGPLQAPLTLLFALLLTLLSTVLAGFVSQAN